MKKTNHSSFVEHLINSIVLFFIFFVLLTFFFVRNKRTDYYVLFTSVKSIHYIIQCNEKTAGIDVLGSGALGKKIKQTFNVFCFCKHYIRITAKSIKLHL